MARYAHDDVLDASLDVIATADEMHLCSQQPGTYAEVATYSLGSVAMVGGNFGTVAGTLGGRRLDVYQEQVPIAVTGTITHIALVDTVGSRLLYVTVGSGEVVAGGFLDVMEWGIEILPPVSGV